MAMEQLLKILLLEDSLIDAELNERALRKADLQFESLRVEREAEYRKALVEFAPDVVIADYSLPDFDGIRALKMIGEMGLEIPFILVSGAMGEERAVESLHQGASDYILKDRLGRLGSAVRRVLGERQQRAQLVESEQARSKSKAHYLAALNSIRDAFVLIDHQGKIIEWNPAAETVFGYSASEAMDKEFHQLVAPERFRDAAARGMRQFAESGQGPYVGKTIETVALHRDGHEFPIELSLSAVQIEGQWQGVGMVRDISERKQLEARLRTMALVVEQSPENIVICNLDAEIEYVNRTFESNTGYSEAEVLGENPRILQSGYTPPEHYEEMWQNLTEGRSWQGEFHNQRKDGSIYIESAHIYPIQ